MSQKAPRGVRLTIALVGRRNAGKSSLINALAGQEIAIVSDSPGTTTDPVAKAYELPPLGPVTFYDTAGLDDEGELGSMRVKASERILWRSDMAVLVLGEEGLGPCEKKILAKIKELELPAVVAFNKTDLGDPQSDAVSFCQKSGLAWSQVSARTGQGIDRLKSRLIEVAPEEFKQEPVLASDLFGEGDQVVCVVPIDLAAPKGRLILPQVQVLREILDSDAMGVIVKERELEKALDSLTQPPALVITDSQVVLKVAGDVPEDVPLTTFSILFARFKGDLAEMARGAQAVDSLKDGSRILLAEACSHHPVADDIGRVKIPRWLTRYTGKKLHFDFYAGHDYPENLEAYDLVIHCGGCMITRAEMMRRIKECRRRNVPITNYGVLISKVQGLLDRVLQPFSLIY